MTEIFDEDDVFDEVYALSYQERYANDAKFRNFVNGIKNHKLTQKEINESGFYYAGGRERILDDGTDTNAKHSKYWALKYGKKQPPLKQRKCVCDHHIENNCYVTDDDVFFLVIGNCCIERFIAKEKQGKLCSNCNSPHNGRKDNLCKECRKTHSQCKECRTPIQKNMLKGETCNQCRTIKCQGCNEYMIFRHNMSICYDCEEFIFE